MKKDFSKPLALLLGTVVTVVTLSCTDAEEVLKRVDHDMGVTTPVCVQVNDFTMSVDEIPEAQTRTAENPSGYNSVGAITLAFYDSNGTMMYEDTQLKEGDSHYTTFGVFSCNLPIGSYTMLVIARDSLKDDVFTLTSLNEAAFTSEKVRETFCKTQDVSVTSSAALDLSVTLNRIVPQLTIKSTDLRPTGVEKIRTTYSAGYKSFNPTTGLGIGNAGFSLINTPNAAVGKVVEFRNNTYLATDEQTMTITLEVLDAQDQVLITKVIPNVPLRRNKKTTLRGPLFTPSASTTSFLLETSWLEGTTVNF